MCLDYFWCLLILVLLWDLDTQIMFLQSEKENFEPQKPSVKDFLLKWR